MTRAAAEPPSRAVAADLDRLVERLPTRHPRSLARAISVVEGGGAPAAELVRRDLPADRARAHRRRHRPAGRRQVDPRRPPRAACCARTARRSASSASIPTRPFSGGALLGDRIRMQGLATDPRRLHPLDGHPRRDGRPGPRDARRRRPARRRRLRLGAGRDRRRRPGRGRRGARASTRCSWSRCPGLGDDIQAIKAGIMEIADVFVLNKADRDGAERTVARSRS